MWIILCLFLVLTTSVNGNESSLYGEIQSPNYPQGYPDNVHQDWNISVPEGFGIRVYFTHVDIEASENCEYDYIKISAEGQVLDVICGRLSPTPGGSPFLSVTESPFSSMTVTFHSDFSNQEHFTGFMAYYVAVDINECEDSFNGEEACTHECNNFIGGFRCSCRPGYFLQEDQRTCGVNCSGEVYTELTGVITSPDYPRAYPENSKCEYKVELEDGYQVVVSFEDQFDVQKDEHSKCNYDILKIKAGERTLGPFCEKPADPIETGINVISIIFHTDGEGENKGWKIKYKASARPCPKTVTDNSRMVPAQPQYVFKDIVKVICLEGFEISLKGNPITSFISECLKDGTWKYSSYECQRMDCGPPEDVENAEVVYKTDPYVDTFEAKIQYKCEEPYYRIQGKGDGTYHCAANGLWTNPEAGTALPACVPVCGKPENPPEAFQRIFRGRPAVKGNFPWQVYFEQPRGGGALIAEQWVLTAAHVAVMNDLTMYAGTLNISSEDLSKAVHLKVEKVFIHPNYISVPETEAQYNYDNDIALIKLKEKIKMGPNIATICIPSKGEEYKLEKDRMGFISGWGRTEKKRLVEQLMYAEIPVVDMKLCQNVSPRTSSVDVTKFYFTENMICAGLKGSDSCHGDSGGAYVFESSDGTFFVGAIVSWGIRCGTYGVYTNMQNYNEWVEKTMAENSDAESS